MQTFASETGKVRALSTIFLNRERAAIERVAIERAAFLLWLH